MASDGGSEAEDPGKENGVPGDYQGGDPSGSGELPRDRHESGACAGDAADHRPAGRVYHLPPALEEDLSGTLCRTRPVGGCFVSGSEGARTDEVPEWNLLRSESLSEQAG